MLGTRETLGHLGDVGAGAALARLGKLVEGYRVQIVSMDVEQVHRAELTAVAAPVLFVDLDTYWPTPDEVELL